MWVMSGCLTQVHAHLPVEGVEGAMGAGTPRRLLFVQAQGGNAGNGDAQSRQCVLPQLRVATHGSGGERQAAMEWWQR